VLEDSNTSVNVIYITTSDAGRIALLTGTAVRRAPPRRFRKPWRPRRGRAPAGSGLGTAGAVPALARWRVARNKAPAVCRESHIADLAS
jgi:hypothetical protein